MVNEQLIGWATECGHEDVRPLLDVLRQRHPEYLPQVWREVMAGSGTAGAKLPLLAEAGFWEEVGNPLPMLIEGLLPDRSLFLLSGKPKAGKSFLALDMAYAVRQGAAVFGKYKVNRPGPVVYLGMEDGKYEIANRLLARGRKKGDAEDTGLIICSERFVLSDAERMDVLRRQLEEIAPSLLIVDTAAEALGIRDWLNRGEITDKVGSLRDLARQVCAVLLVSHNRKSDGDAGDEIAGSNAFTGAVDGWLSAYKVESLPSGNRRLYLRTEGRGGVRGELAVEMDTKTLHFSCLSAEEIAEGETSGSEAAKDDMAEKIARAISDHSGQATVKQISEIMEWPISTMNRHVQRLLASGFLVDAGKRAPAPEVGGRAAIMYAVAG